MYVSVFLLQNCFAFTVFRIRLVLTQHHAFESHSNEGFIYAVGNMNVTEVIQSCWIHRIDHFGYCTRRGMLIFSRLCSLSCQNSLKCYIV